MLQHPDIIKSIIQALGDILNEQALAQFPLAQEDEPSQELLKLLSALQEKTLRLVQEKEEAQATNRVNQELLDNALEALRAPLHAIMNYTDLGLNAQESEMHSIKKYLQHISSNVMTMLGVIQNFKAIEVANAPLVQGDFGIYTVIHCVQQAEAEVRPLFAQYSVHISINNLAAHSTTLYCDCTLIVQMLVNLLTEAAHASPAGKTVKVNIRDHLYEVNDAQYAAIIIEIIDKGAPVPLRPGFVWLEPVGAQIAYSHYQPRLASAIAIKAAAIIIHLHRGRIWAPATGADNTVCLMLPCRFHELDNRESIHG